jgi:hypothetical protein
MTTGADTGERAKEVAGTAQDESKQLAQSAAESGKDVAATAKDQASTVVGEATTHAKNLAGTAKDQVSSQVGTQKSRLVETLRTTGDELKSGSGERSQLTDQLTSRVATQAHAVADYLDDHGPSEMLDHLSAYARRRPGAFIAGAAVLGVVAGRLVRGVVSASKDDSSGGSAGAHRLTSDDAAIGTAQAYEPVDVVSTTPAGGTLADPTPIGGDYSVVDPGASGRGGTGYSTGGTL